MAGTYSYRKGEIWRGGYVGSRRGVVSPGKVRPVDASLRAVGLGTTWQA